MPDEDWFCDKCKPTAVAAKKKMANKRKIFSITDDELSEPSSDEEEQIEDDGVPVFYKQYVFTLLTHIFFLIQIIWT